MTDIMNASAHCVDRRVRSIGAQLAKAIIAAGSEYERTENKGLAAEFSAAESAFHARLTHCLIGLLTEIPEYAESSPGINRLEELGDICYYAALGLHVLRMTGLQEQAIILALRNTPMCTIYSSTKEFLDAVVTTIDLVVKKGFICGKYPLASCYLASLNTFMLALVFVLSRLPATISLEELLEAEQYKVFAHKKLIAPTADPLDKFAALAERVG